MQLNISFDTITKQLSVGMDGQMMDDVSSVHISKRYSDIGSEDTYSCEIITSDSDNDSKVYTMTRVMANEIQTEILDNKKDNLNKKIHNFLTKNK